MHKAYDSLEGCEVAWNTVKLVGVPEDEKKRIINEVILKSFLPITLGKKKQKEGNKK